MADATPEMLRTVADYLEIERAKDPLGFVFIGPHTLRALADELETDQRAAELDKELARRAQDCICRELEAMAWENLSTRGREIRIRQVEFIRKELEARGNG